MWRWFSAAMPDTEPGEAGTKLVGVLVRARGLDVDGGSPWFYNQAYFTKSSQTCSLLMSKGLSIPSQPSDMP
jgi:hypothetical protein